MNQTSKNNNLERFCLPFETTYQVIQHNDCIQVYPLESFELPSMSHDNLLQQK